MSSIDSMPTIAVDASALTVDPEVLAMVRAAAAAAKDLKEVGEKEQDLDKQIEAQVAAINRAVGALYGEIERGPSPGEAFGVPEGTLGDAEALELKLYDLQKERNELKSQEYKLTRQLRAARVAMRQVPFEKLIMVVKSEKWTEEEYEATKAEMRRREMLCLAIRHILGGKYWMPHKGRKYCVYDWFDSAAREVRNEPVEEIARFAFSEEDAKTIGKAVCGLLGRDGSDVALTELCGLSAEHGPWFVRLEDYQKLMVENKDNVDLIFGTALKEKLRSVDPDRWYFWEDSADSADSVGREGREGREAKSARAH